MNSAFAEPTSAVTDATFPGTVFVRQRLLPEYRAKLFDLVAQQCSGGCVIAAGKPTKKEATHIQSQLQTATVVELNQKTILSGVLETYYQFGLKKILSNSLPDIFVTNPNPRMLDSYFTTRYLRKKGVPCVALGIGTTDFWDQPFKKIRRWYRQTFLSQFDGFLCYGSKAAQQYADLGISADRIITVYNSVVPRPSGPPRTRPTEFADGKAKVVTIGRLIASKGFDRLIHAAKIAADQGTNIEVWIVGDGPEKSNLEQLAAETKSPVKFLGRQTGDTLAETCFQSDLFVLPGLGGLAIQEAMAHALPVIVTQADGTELDLVRENGWIVEKENVKALASVLTDAISDPGKLRIKGEESFRIVQDEINLELMAQRFVAGICQISELGMRD